MENGGLDFLPEKLDRSCFFCAEKSTGVAAGKNGNFHYKLPYCPFHKGAAEEKVLEQIEEKGQRMIPY